MKKLFFFLPVIFIATSIIAQSTEENQEIQNSDIHKVIDFSETDHDFGKIPYGKPAEFNLLMKNISNDTVRIQEVRAGCGCTTPKWQPGPYNAGETFKVTIGFNGYTEGNFNKVVTVYLTNGQSQVIKFHGQTYKAPDNPAPPNGAIERLKSGSK